MANIPQKLSEAQRTEVKLILRPQILTWTLVALALLTGITGLSLWGIMLRTQANMEGLVADQFKEPRIRETLNLVASNQAATLLRDEVNPSVNDFRHDVSNQVQQFQSFLHGMQLSLTNTENRISLAESEISSTSNQIEALNTNVARMLASTESHTHELLSQLLQASKDIEVLRLYLDAKQGSMAAYNLLSQWNNTNGSPRAAALAKAASDELWLAVEDVRQSGIPRGYQFYIGGVFQNTRPCAETVFADLIFANVNQQICAVNYVKDQNLKYFTQTLVDVVASNENWRVAGLSVSALEHLTGKHFEKHPPYDSVREWWQTEGRTNNLYKNPIFLVGNTPQTLPPSGKSSDALPDPEVSFKNILEGHPGLCATRLQFAQYLLLKQKRIEAKEQLEAIQNECDLQREAGQMLARILVEDHKLDEAATLLHKLRGWYEPTFFDKILLKDPVYTPLTNRFPEITKE